MKLNRSGAAFAISMALVCGPFAAHAANVCNGKLDLTYPTGPNFGVPGSSDPTLTTYTVNLALSAGSITGVTGPLLTIHRVRFDLDCVGSPSLTCSDQGPVVEYGGDTSILTDCPVGWTTNVPSGGSATNEIIFTPTSPGLTQAPGSPPCNLSFTIRVVSQEPVSGGQSDTTPLSIEEVAGYIQLQGDATCNNGLAAGNQVTGSIPVCPVCTDTDCSTRSCSQETGTCDVLTPKPDSGACTTDNAGNPVTAIPGACKTPGCEAGECVRAHVNVTDSTVCSADNTGNPVTSIPGACKTPGCEAGICVAQHVPVNDSTACSIDNAGNPVTAIPGSCKTPGCESGQCVPSHINVTDSTSCSVDNSGKTVGAIPGACKTPGCEAGECVAQHIPVTDSTACSVDNAGNAVTPIPGACKTPGCEAGVCVRAHVNVTDSTACSADNSGNPVNAVPGACKTPGCEAGVCVVQHVSVTDSTACSVDNAGNHVGAIPGSCKTPGCESGQCVQTHINVTDSTVCSVDNAGNPVTTVPGACKTPGCEAGNCVAQHVPVTDSNACSVDNAGRPVTAIPGSCKTPGCEAGQCVQSHINVTDSTPCTDNGTCPSTPTAGCEGGTCVQTHLPCPTTTTTTSTTSTTTPCNLSVSKSACVTQPPPTGGSCTGGAIALTLQYTGPAISGPTTVTITGNSGVSVTYNLPSLNPGDILTMASENGFTIDATAHNQSKLGATTTITINGVKEVLHTSCSCKNTPDTNLKVCNPVCLDSSSPDNPTGSKGPGSPLWTLVSEIDPTLGTQTCPSSTDGQTECVSELPTAPAPPNCKGKIQSLQLKYVGGGCAAMNESQDKDKVSCTQVVNTPNASPVQVRVTDDKGNTVFLDTGTPASVNIGDTINVVANVGGKTTLTDNTRINVLNASGTLIESLKFKSDCSQPVNLGDIFGGFQVVGISSTEGGTVTNGGNVEFRYTIKNNGTSTVTNITVVDDKIGTVPGSPITSLAPGEEVMLVSSQTSVQGTTVNTVTVSGNGATCPGGNCCAEATAAVVGPCVLGYPFSSQNPRTSVDFNESEVLRAIRPAVARPGDSIQVFYNDEHALTLGIRRVIVKTASGSTVTDFPVSPLPASPSGVMDPAVGTTDLNGPLAGTDTNTCPGFPDLCDRPIFPSLFITDITNDLTDRSGDWQFGVIDPFTGAPKAESTPIPPDAVFGTWKAAVRTVDSTKTPAVVTVTPDQDPAKNDWDLDGGDTAPAGLTNQGFGAEARWDVNTLGLQAGHVYRVQVMVHDGDQNKTGGDTGEACATVFIPQQ